MWKKKKERTETETTSYFDKKYFRIKECHLIDDFVEDFLYTPQFDFNCLKKGQTVDHRGFIAASPLTEERWVNLSDPFDTKDEAKQACYNLKPKRYLREIKIYDL